MRPGRASTPAASRVECKPALCRRGLERPPGALHWRPAFLPGADLQFPVIRTLQPHPISPWDFPPRDAVYIPADCSIRAPSRCGCGRPHGLHTGAPPVPAMMFVYLLGTVCLVPALGSPGCGVMTATLTEPWGAGARPTKAGCPGG